MPQRPLTDEEKEKLRSVGYLRQKGTSRKTIKDARGSFQEEHWDGRVDATINPEAIRLKAVQENPEVK